MPTATAPSMLALGLAAKFAGSQSVQPPSPVPRAALVRLAYNVTLTHPRHLVCCSRYVVSWRSYRDPSLYASTLLYRSPDLPAAPADKGKGKQKAEWWGITNECPHLNAPLERKCRPTH